MSKKRVLVYPCGTEIGLEIYRSVSHSIHYELVGGSSTYDHGRFVYKQHIDNLPFITDESTSNDIVEFNRILIENDIDFLYPAMDGVLYKFSEFRNLISCEVICPSFDTAKITRSKKETYEFSKGDMFIINRNVIHRFVYHEDSVLVAFYDNGVELPDGTKDIIAEADA